MVWVQSVAPAREGPSPPWTKIHESKVQDTWYARGVGIGEPPSLEIAAFTSGERAVALGIKRRHARLLRSKLASFLTVFGRVCGCLRGRLVQEEKLLPPRILAAKVKARCHRTRGRRG